MGVIYIHRMKFSGTQRAGASGSGQRIARRYCVVATGFMRTRNSGGLFRRAPEKIGLFDVSPMPMRYARAFARRRGRSQMEGVVTGIWSGGAQLEVLSRRDMNDGIEHVLCTSHGRDYVSRDRASAQGCAPYRRIAASIRTFLSEPWPSHSASFYIYLYLISLNMCMKTLLQS